MKNIEQILSKYTNTSMPQLPRSSASAQKQTHIQERNLHVNDVSSVNSAQADLRKYSAGGERVEKQNAQNQQPADRLLLKDVMEQSVTASALQQQGAAHMTRRQPQLSIDQQDSVLLANTGDGRQAALQQIEMQQVVQTQERLQEQIDDVKEQIHGIHIEILKNNLQTKNQLDTMERHIKLILQKVEQHCL